MPLPILPTIHGRKNVANRQHERRCAVRQSKHTQFPLVMASRSVVEWELKLLSQISRPSSRLRDVHQFGEPVEDAELERRELGFVQFA